MRFTIYQESRIGTRPSNQDRIAYCYSRDALLMMVADGMGGHQHGELAAHLATQFITHAFQREAQPRLADPAHFLSRTLLAAHYAIVDDSYDRRLAEPPRTTVVVCVIQGGVAWWAHAGDSRLYLLRENSLQTRTRDHSRLQLLIDQGSISEQEAAAHPGRNRIYSCLGGTRIPQFDYSEPQPLQNGDLIALCTDGLWGPLDDDHIAAQLGSAPPAQAVPLLLDRAELESAGHSDNLSMLAMCWHDEHSQQHADSIFTQTMALDDFATQIDVGERSPAALDEDEIERAIREINEAINKLDP